LKIIVSYQFEQKEKFKWFCQFEQKEKINVTLSIATRKLDKFVDTTCRTYTNNVVYDIMKTNRQMKISLQSAIPLTFLAVCFWGWLTTFQETNRHERV